MKDGYTEKCKSSNVHNRFDTEGNVDMSAEIDANKNVRLTSHHCPLIRLYLICDYKVVQQSAENFSAHVELARRARQEIDKEKRPGCML